MYVAKINKLEDLSQIYDFVDKNSFATLVNNQADGKLWATHIPIELDEDENGERVLVGHVGKANPQWHNFVEDKPVLAIFQGAHTYISSSWYDHDNVPTWNYSAVHIYGTIKIITGERLMQTLSRLVDKYEAHSKHPVSVATMTEKTLREVRGLVGFEIKITEIHAARKLSQNRDDSNHENIIQELRKRGDANSVAIADEMQIERAKKHKSHE